MAAGQIERLQLGPVSERADAQAQKELAIWAANEGSGVTVISTYPLRSRRDGWWWEEEES
jgi:hypothetical protein